MTPRYFRIMNASRQSRYVSAILPAPSASRRVAGIALSRGIVCNQAIHGFVLAVTNHPERQLVSFIFVCAVGLLAGTISGIVGTGSSIMLMPVLVYEFGPRKPCRSWPLPL